MELAQHICNDLLDYMQEKGIPVKLRSDYVSVEDTKSNAGRSYRVIALVEPANRFDAELLALGAEKVLMHGPGAVAWVDEQGNWHKVIDPKTGEPTAPEDIVPILVTTDAGKIVEHQPKNPGEPGELGYAHQAGEQGKFCLMAAQVMDLDGRKVVIVSGESPYFGYQSLVTYQYHGKLLDGPRFFRNLVLWATANYAELKAAKQLMAQSGKEVAAELEKKVDEKIKALEEKVNKAAVQAEEVNAKIQQLQNEINNLKNTISGMIQQQIQQQLQTVQTKASNAYTFAIGGLVLAVIAIIAAGLAMQKKS
jgi:FKBP-type peptidyl-prolyl cis-trans isomerase